MARFGGYRIGMRKGFTVQALVAQLFAVLIALYVGGVTLNAFGTAMLSTCSVFYNGLSLIGWTVNASNCITATSSGGVLAVVGIVALANVVRKAVYIKK